MHREIDCYPHETQQDADKSRKAKNIQVQPKAHCTCLANKNEGVINFFLHYGVIRHAVGFFQDVSIFFSRCSPIHYHYQVSGPAF